MITVVKLYFSSCIECYKIERNLHFGCVRSVAQIIFVVQATKQWLKFGCGTRLDIDTITLIFFLPYYPPLSYMKILVRVKKYI